MRLRCRQSVFYYVPAAEAEEWSAAALSHAVCVPQVDAEDKEFEECLVIFLASLSLQPLAAWVNEGVSVDGVPPRCAADLLGVLHFTMRTALIA